MRLVGRAVLMTALVGVVAGGLVAGTTPAAASAEAVLTVNRSSWGYIDVREPLKTFTTGEARVGVYAAEVLDVVRRAGITDPESARATAIGLIAELITRELVVAGDVDQSGHVPWNCTPGGAIERITREWLGGWQRSAPPPGAIVWLDTTRTGERIGREVLERE